MTDVPTETIRVAVLGSGSWGTALAHHARRAGATVEIWGRDAGVLESIANEGKNPKYVKELHLAAGIIAQPSLEAAVREKDLIILAVPSSALRPVVSQVSEILRGSSTVLLSGIKGIERDTLLTPTQVLQDELGQEAKVSVLSGPSFAAELIEGYPTAVTVAAHSPEIAEFARAVLHYGNLRVYTSDDVIGVEFGGAVKNVIALATGLVDGVGMGDNARAALITRGLAELQFLIVALGGDARTIAGLAGLGDLLLTAVGNQSRNRQVGLRLGRGEDLASITKELGQVAEGVRSTHFILQLAQQHGIDMPIVEQTDAVLNGSCTVEEAVANLLAREATVEIKALQ